MSSVHTTPTTDALDPGDAGSLRRAGWQLIASPGAFLLGLIAAVVGGIVSGTAQAESEAAQRPGVTVAELPADVLAVIHEDDSWIAGVLVALPFLAAPVLLVLGVRSASQVATPRLRGFGLLATVLAVGSALAWAYVQVASPVNAESLQRFVFPAVVVSTALGSAAVVAVVVVLRGRGVARRAGLVVGVLGALATAGAFFVVPPFAPYVLALVLGTALARTRPSATM
jgi:hypothetical protein